MKILDFFRDIFSPGSTSEQFKTNIRDWLKGLVVAIGTAPITIIGQTIETSIATGNFNFVIDWNVIWKVAVAGLFSYIFKNFFSSKNPAQTPPATNSDSQATK